MYHTHRVSDKSTCVIPPAGVGWEEREYHPAYIFYLFRTLNMVVYIHLVRRYWYSTGRKYLDTSRFPVLSYGKTVLRERNLKIVHETDLKSVCCNLEILTQCISLIFFILLTYWISEIKIRKKVFGHLNKSTCYQMANRVYENNYNKFRNRHELLGKNQ